MPVPIVAVAWTWITANSANAFVAATAAVTAFVKAADYIVQSSREAELESYLLGDEFKRQEVEMLDASATISTSVEDMVKSFSSVSVNPSEYVPQVNEISVPENPITLVGSSFMEHLAEANRLKEQELTLMSSMLEIHQDQNRKFVNQNEILYKQTVEMMEANKFAMARLALDQAHMPVMSRAAVQQAANVRTAREQNEAIKAQELYATINNNVATPEVNVNATVDTVPIAATMSVVNDNLSTMADNALKQKEVAEAHLRPRTVFNAYGDVLATGTAIDIHAEASAALAKNHIDESEFELDEDTLGEMTGLNFSIPTSEGLTAEELTAHLNEYMEGRI